MSGPGYSWNTSMSFTSVGHHHHQLLLPHQAGAKFIYSLIRVHHSEASVLGLIKLDLANPGLTEGFLFTFWPTNPMDLTPDQPEGLSRLKTCQGRQIAKAEVRRRHDCFDLIHDHALKNLGLSKPQRQTMIHVFLNRSWFASIISFFLPETKLFYQVGWNDNIPPLCLYYVRVR